MNVVRRWIHIPRRVGQISKKSMAKRDIDVTFFDLSGTIIDNNGDSVKVSIYDTFERKHISLNSREIRCATGLDKFTHIKAILALPSVIEKWEKVFWYKPGIKDVEMLLDDFRVRQLETMKDEKYTTLLPNTLVTINYLRKKYGMMYGGTTGFPNCITTGILRHLAGKGFKFNDFISADQVAKPRPYPNAIEIMLFRFQRTPNNFVKVGDTKYDMQEGNNADGVCVGLVDSSDIMGKCLETPSFYATGVFNYKQAYEYVFEELWEGGADYIIPNITSLPAVIDDIHRKANHDKLSRCNLYLRG